MENPINIHPIFDQLVTRQERERFLNQQAGVFWLTGLSGSGKSTIAKGVERQLFGNGLFTQVLDGDNIRAGINQNLGFTIEARKENIRRIAEVAKLYINSGVIVICSFISPTQAIRDYAKEIIGPNDFKEVYIKAPLSICESRDVKGLYKKARAGKISGFTGIDSPYDEPQNPDLLIDTEANDIEQSINSLFRFIKKYAHI